MRRRGDQPSGAGRRLLSSGSGAFSRFQARRRTGRLSVPHPCGAWANPPVHRRPLRLPKAGALTRLGDAVSTERKAATAHDREHRGPGSTAVPNFHRSRTVDQPTPTGVGFVASRRCAIAAKDADLRSEETEAQALTLEQVRDELPNGARMEWATVRNGDVVETGRIEVPDEYYTAAAGSAIECLMTARNTVLHERPRIRANSVVNMLVGDGLLSRDDAQHAVALVEVNLRKQVEEMYEAGRAELSGRFPLLLRTLIPLIRRSIRK